MKALPNARMLVPGCRCEYCVSVVRSEVQGIVARVEAWTTRHKKSRDRELKRFLSLPLLKDS